MYIHICTYIYTCICIHVYTSMYIYIYICVCLHVHTYVLVYIHMCTYICIYTCTYIYVHAYFKQLVIARFTKPLYLVYSMGKVCVRERESQREINTEQEKKLERETKSLKNYYSDTKLWCSLYFKSNGRVCEERETMGVCVRRERQWACV